jgi:hypothetical protein
MWTTLTKWISLAFCVLEDPPPNEITLNTQLLEVLKYCICLPTNGAKDFIVSTSETGTCGNAGLL